MISQRAIKNNFPKETKETKETKDNKNVYIFFYNGVQYIYKICKIIINICGIYLLWIVLHFVASHLYIKWCVPSTIIGFLMSPFMTATPHCQGLRWIVYNAANMINNMWLIFGAWICSTLLIVNRQSDESTSTPIPSVISSN
jgi:hypothetical protein